MFQNHANSCKGSTLRLLREHTKQMSAAAASPSTTTGNKFVRQAKPQEDPLLKAVKVKTGTLKRNIKDRDFALSEVKREEGRLEKIQREDPDKTQQQLNVIAESKMMLPLAENRIRKSMQELRDLLADNADAIAAGELKDTAEQAIAEAEALFEQEA